MYTSYVCKDMYYTQSLSFGKSAVAPFPCWKMLFS